ncbi:GATA zinc finger domain-containing protein 10 [Fusarium oxysporum f. sp. albedinis]|nr:GATA zinc finger domain-containing protein 10 [Fusarium oxysporum f. sp. albedinis]
MLQLATLVLETKWFPTLLLLNQLFSDLYKVYSHVGLTSERQGLALDGRVVSQQSAACLGMPPGSTNGRVWRRTKEAKCTEHGYRSIFSLCKCPT